MDNRETTIAQTSQEEIINRLFKPQEQRPFDEFVLDKFPREFKKEILRSLDFRFIIILLLTFITHIISILYLEKEYPIEIDSGTISRIQQQYVKFLIESETTSSAPASLTITGSEQAEKFQALDSKTIIGLTEWMDVFADKALEAIKEMPAFNPDAAGLTGTTTKGVEYLTKEELRYARARGSDARIQARADLEKEVSSIGLLGLIGSKSHFMEQEYIDDLLEYADLNDDHLVSVLAKLKSIQVPRHTTAAYILQYKKGADASSRGLEGGRQFADSANENIMENIEPLETAKTTEMKRVVEYEDIPSENPLTKLRSGEYTGKFRNSKDVVRIVQSHRRALQDCYKQELKTNPKLYGKIEVRFSIDPEGKVVDASIVSSSLRSPRMEACIIHRIKNWRDFGYSDPAEGNVTYKQSFNFGN